MESPPICRAAVPPPIPVGRFTPEPYGPVPVCRFPPQPGPPIPVGRFAPEPYGPVKLQRVDERSIVPVPLPSQPGPPIPFGLQPGPPILVGRFAPEPYGPVKRQRVDEQSIVPVPLPPQPGPPIPVGRFAPEPYGPVKLQRVAERSIVPVPLPPQPGPHERLAPDSPIITAEIERMLRLMFGSPHNHWRIPNYLITAFVEAIEEGHQYFDLFDFLREEYHLSQYLSSQDTFLDVLVEEIKNMDKFNKLDDDVIQHAVNERISEFKDEQDAHKCFEYTMFLRTSDFIDINDKFSLYESRFRAMFPSLNSSDLLNGFEYNRLCLMTAHLSKDMVIHREKTIKAVRDERLRRCHRPKEEDGYVRSHPVYKLVLSIREEGYVMEQNPEAELRTDILYDEWFFYHYMKDGPMENLLYQARTVTVNNVSLNATEQDIKQLFSCWEIEHITMKMDIKSGHKSQLVVVVFKNLQGTEGALVMQGLTVLDLPVIIKPCLGFEQRRALAAYLMSEPASFIHSYEAKVKFEQALEKYRWLRMTQVKKRRFPSPLKLIVEYDE